MNSTSVVSSSASADLRRGRHLEYFTIAWNAIEALVSIVAGYLAGSTALIGFGVDSSIETISGGALLWRLQDHEHHATRERAAHRLVGYSFLLLAAYVAYEAVRSLLQHEVPEVSKAGIAIATLSLIVMPVLAREKRRTARRIQSRALEADSRQTSLCAYLSAILLAGLVLNAWLGWWWADPVAALAMVPIMAHEGVKALRGEPCETCS